MDVACAVDLSTTGLPRSTCPNCGFADWSQFARLSSGESRRFDDRIAHCRRIKRDDYLYHAGSAITSLHVINSGFLLTSIMGDGGNAQIVGFSMRGDMVGLEAIGAGRHGCDTIALEDSTLCGISIYDLEQLAQCTPSLQRRFHRAISSEIVRDHAVMFQLGSMRAEERVAQFLLNLSGRFAARGCSELRFRLPMGRREIGNFLGLKLETVSRALARLGNLDLIGIEGKDIELKSVERLRRITGAQTRAPLSTHCNSPGAEKVPVMAT